MSGTSGRSCTSILLMVQTAVIVYLALFSGSTGETTTVRGTQVSAGKKAEPKKAAEPAAAAPAKAQEDPEDRMRQLRRLMHLHMDVLADKDNNNMGHTGNIQDQTEANFAMIRANKPDATTICEIGFNVGHSAATFLSAQNKPPADYYIFDIFEHKSVEWGMEYLKKVFPETKFHDVRGDSTGTVPNFVRTYKDKVVCDIIHVDGAHHGDIPWQDMENMKPLAREGTFWVLDDCGCNAADGWWCKDPTIAFNRAVEHGYVRPVIKAGDIKFKGKGTCAGFHVPAKA